MFNETYKKKTVRALEEANQSYSKIFQCACTDMDNLHKSRLQAIRVIRSIDGYICELANRPRDYDTKISDIRLRYLEFDKRIAEIKKMSEAVEDNSKSRFPGMEICAGISCASAFAPSVAVSVAMAFGTTSTGVAISSLSGVAATNAALAWLGGGTLAMGGAGIAGGQALLATIGPVGLIIGGVPLTAGFLMTAIRNKEIAEKAEKATTELLREIERIREIDVTVVAWNKETIRLTNQLSRQYGRFRNKKDYMGFSGTDKEELNIMMNMTEVLSKKLKETVS